VHIGTSGWSYASWRGPFFPTEVMVKHHLQYYATQFATAELNGVFYRTPSLETVREWRRQTRQRYCAAHFRSSRCAFALGGDSASCVFARPRAGWRLQGPILR
jgi:hypothetical protein